MKARDLIELLQENLEAEIVLINGSEYLSPLRDPCVEITREDELLLCLQVDVFASHVYDVPSRGPRRLKDCSKMGTIGVPKVEQS